jgi:hypothetical protein
MLGAQSNATRDETWEIFLLFFRSSGSGAGWPSPMAVGFIERGWRATEPPGRGGRGGGGSKKTVGTTSTSSRPINPHVRRLDALLCVHVQGAR